MDEGFALYAEMECRAEDLQAYVKQEKIRLGKTNQQMIDESGVARSTVNNYFAGALNNLGVVQLSALCRVLNVTLDAKMGLRPEEDVPEVERLKMELRYKEELLAEKDKAISRLEERSRMMEHEISAVRSSWKGVTYGATGLSVLFGLFLMIYVFLDMRNPNIGLFRGTTAAPIVYVAAFSIVGTCLYIGHTMVKRKIERKRKNADDTH